ncbi:ABC transporter ATP-binding protein [Jannaschia sp. M317]|uniref:ABC transporter ATP-binding protein n=1 Tax=Jannaschia sp. M317 TaxID=2867011 RepID=UPI0021A87811|nr:ABC transporter ATP-binding protein [Jannaschia sp. M317]UWQ19880.1 ABC transporter ATP-binding protein [Jannaschia sp. M317]
MNAIDLNAVTKSFPAFELGPIDLGIRKGELLGIFGPPSSGKTSVLKIILGLLQQDGGEVALAGVSGSELGVSERGLSMVFQNLALFPHLSGAENITFPLREAGTDATRIAERLEAVSRVLHVEHILHKKPGQMSGGERQRIALGRALAAESGAVLLDEPISALDARLREEMRLELKRLQREQGQTFVYVSHDEEEVMAIADRIAILIDGKIAQLGTPDEVYNTPATSAVAALVGSPPMNLIPGRVAEDGRSFQSDALKDPIALPRQVRAGPVTLGVRPKTSTSRRARRTPLPFASSRSNRWAATASSTLPLRVSRCAFAPHVTSPRATISPRPCVSTSRACTSSIRTATASDPCRIGDIP